MLELNDPRWDTLKGGYRLPFDPRNLVISLESAFSDESLWNDLFSELYHQGDIGEASYAAVVLFSKSEALMKALPWQMVALAASVELARTKVQNPAVPDWFISDYQVAVTLLASRSCELLQWSCDAEQARSMLAMVAIGKSLRMYARSVLDYSEEELSELLPV